LYNKDVFNVDDKDVFNVLISSMFQFITHFNLCCVPCVEL
jgi:hypothetical protein